MNGCQMLKDDVGATVRRSLGLGAQAPGIWDLGREKAERQRRAVRRAEVTSRGHEESPREVAPGAQRLLLARPPLRPGWV